MIVHDPYAGDMVWWEGYLSVVGDKIYLSADNGVDGHELYVIESGSSSVDDEIFVMENQPAGTVIAQFNAIDWDGDDLTYHLSGFEILDKTKPNEGIIPPLRNHHTQPLRHLMMVLILSRLDGWLLEVLFRMYGFNMILFNQQKFQVIFTI